MYPEPRSCWNLLLLPPAARQTECGLPACMLKAYCCSCCRACSQETTPAPLLGTRSPPPPAAGDSRPPPAAGSECPPSHPQRPPPWPCPAAGRTQPPWRALPTPGAGRRTYRLPGWPPYCSGGRSARRLLRRWHRPGSWAPSRWAAHETAASSSQLRGGVHNRNKRGNGLVS